MAAGDIYRFTRLVEIDGVRHVNVMHFMEDVGVGADPEEQLIDSWLDIVQPWRPESELKDLQQGYSSMTYLGFTAQRILPTEGQVIVRPSNQNPAGPLDSGLPTFAQTKVNFTTGRQDRSGRGGIYLGAIPEGQTDGNNVTSSYTDAFAQFAQALIEVYTASGSQFAGFTLGVFSRLLLEFNPITGISMNSDMGTMRSRRVGRGV